MARRTAEELSGTPLSLLYIAGNLSEAKRVEDILSGHGIDYTLTLQPFVKTSFLGIIFGGSYMGLYVLVPTAQHRFCAELLHARGLRDAIPVSVYEEKEDGA
jgi:hypothetical protein